MQAPQLAHPAWIEVDVAALAHNARVLRRALPPGARLGILVKANGYGHGLEMAARAALAGRADQLIVAALAEGLALRRAGIEAPILVVYPILPDAVVEAVEAGLELSLSGLSSGLRLLEAWGAAQSSTQRTLAVHVEVDTGMGRGGVATDNLSELVQRIERSPRTKLVGIWSHLADGSDADVSGEQVRRFEAAVARLGRSGRQLPTLHLAATEGLVAGTAPVYGMVRIGLGFYGSLGLGVEPAPSRASLAASLRPAMTVKTRPIRLELMARGSTVGYGGEWTADRASLIATLPVGYADGWARACWPGAVALVRGRRVPLVGRVSMDSVCADVTDAGDVTLDDEFVLLGAQGGERITVEELARLRRSIPNEVLCAFGPRLPRVYLADGRVVATAHAESHVERVPGAAL